VQWSRWVITHISKNVGTELKSSSRLQLTTRLDQALRPPITTYHTRVRIDQALYKLASAHPLPHECCWTHHMSIEMTAYIHLTVTEFQHQTPFHTFRHIQPRLQKSSEIPITRVRNDSLPRAPSVTSRSQASGSPFWLEARLSQRPCETATKNVSSLSYTTPTVAPADKPLILSQRGWPTLDISQAIRRTITYEITDRLEGPTTTF
jgi:hypothetical protein